MTTVTMKKVLVPPPTEAQIDELRRNHEGSDLHQLAFLDDRVTVVVRNPTRTEFRQWKDGVANKQGDARLRASEVFATRCVVYPTAEELANAVERFPGLLDSIAGEVTELAGIQQAASKKAL